MIKDYLSDLHHTDNDVIVSCYSSPTFKPVAPSNQLRAAKDFYIDQLKKKEADANQEEVSEKQQPPPTIQELKQEEEESPTKKKRTGLIDEFKLSSPERIENSFKVKQILQKDRQRAVSLSGKPSYVIPGFSYALVDSFFNDQFNMVYVQKRSDQEIKLRQEYYELCKNATTQKMNKDQKLEYRKKKNKLKSMISEEDKKRIELITKPPIQYKFFKIKTNVGRVPILNIYCPFSAEEIETAKTCIINELTKPPNYEVPEIRGKPPLSPPRAQPRLPPHKHTLTQSPAVHAAALLSFFCLCPLCLTRCARPQLPTADDGKSVISAQKQEESFVMKPLEDFSAIPHHKKPLQRGLGGHWLKDQDMIGCFQNFQIFYNPKKIPNYRLQQVNYDPNYEITHNQDCELILIKKNQEQADTLDKKLLIGFQYKNSKSQEIRPSPYCIMQKFDFEQFMPIHDYEPLQDNNLSQLVSLKNQNTIIRFQVYSPLSYALQLSCENQYELLNIFDYLK